MECSAATAPSEAALRRRVAELRKERESLRRIIQAKEKATEKLRERHAEETRAAQRRPRRPTDAPAMPEKRVTAGLESQAGTIASLKTQLALTERRNARLREDLAALQDAAYIEGLDQSIQGRVEHVQQLEADIAGLGGEIARLDKEVLVSPEQLSPLPAVGLARDKLQVLDLQALLYARREEFLFAYMGELGREFGFLTPLLTEDMLPEDCVACMRAIREHLARAAEGQEPEAEAEDQSQDSSSNQGDGEGTPRSEDGAPASRSDWARTLVVNIACLLRAFHKARRVYDVCKQLQDSLVEIYRSLLVQMKAFEGPLSDTEGDGKILAKAQEALRHLAERAEAIRKYAEEYQKYSGEIMQIE